MLNDPVTSKKVKDSMERFNEALASKMAKEVEGNEPNDEKNRDKSGSSDDPYIGMKVEMVNLRTSAFNGMKGTVVGHTANCRNGVLTSTAEEESG